MLAEAYRIAGQTALMNTYRDAAIAAYNHASGLADQQLDATQDVGYTTVRGRDLKMTAAAYLFNVTGTTAYEDVVNAESVCRTGIAELENDTRNQTWATAALSLHAARRALSGAAGQHAGLRHRRGARQGSGAHRDAGPRGGPRTTGRATSARARTCSAR